MKNLNEIFKGEKEIKFAEDIIGIVSESLAVKTGMGIILSVLTGELARKGDYSESALRYPSLKNLREFVGRLVEEDYLTLYHRDFDGNNGVRLSASYLHEISRTI